jgi:hypothetical protein
MNKYLEEWARRTRQAAQQTAEAFRSGTRPVKQAVSDMRDTWRAHRPTWTGGGTQYNTAAGRELLEWSKSPGFRDFRRNIRKARNTLLGRR